MFASLTRYIDFAKSSDARLPRMVAEIDVIAYAITSISATMRGKRASDDFAKSIYRVKDANMDYANSAIARIFSISDIAN